MAPAQQPDAAEEDRAPLPPPVTIEQCYLAAIAAELRALRAALTPRPTLGGASVRLQEPQPKERRR